jgi:hypothetical protein
MIGAMAIAAARLRPFQRRSIGRLVTAAAVTLTAFASHPAFGQSDRFVERLNGQTVAPAYDGFETNPDGTYSMWFSYFNRNREERLDVPVGPDNRFEPGPIDRGQPTHFVPLWQKANFRVVLPKDWGDKRLTWLLTTHGQTNQVIATLNPRAMIDRQKETLEGGEAGENKAPQVSAEPASQTITVSAAASFTVSATDDGRPANRVTKKPEGLNVRWRKFRGPQNGQVSFAPAAATLVDGKSAATATFSQPGEYVVQAIVDDSSLLSGTYCCWINSELKVIVTK